MNPGACAASAWGLERDKGGQRLALGLANGGAGSPSGGKGYASPRRHRFPGTPFCGRQPGSCLAGRWCQASSC